MDRVLLSTRRYRSPVCRKGCALRVTSGSRGHSLKPEVLSASSFLDSSLPWHVYKHPKAEAAVKIGYRCHLLAFLLLVLIFIFKVALEMEPRVFALSYIHTLFKKSHRTYDVAQVELEPVALWPEPPKVLG